MIKNRRSEPQTRLCKRLRSSFSTCLLLFVRAAHAFAPGAYLSFIKRSFSDSRLRIIPTFTFSRSVPSEESAAAGAYLRLLPPVPVCLLCCSAAAQRACSRSGSLCRTARRCRKEAAASGKSGRCGSATAGTKNNKKRRARRCKKCKLNTNTLDCKPQLL